MIISVPEKRLKIKAFLFIIYLFIIHRRVVVFSSGLLTARHDRQVKLV